jgi:hypothetical protein
MMTLLASLGEIAAFRLRVLAKAIGAKDETAEREAARKALDGITNALSAKAGPSGLPAKVVLHARGIAQQQALCIKEGALVEADVLAWASNWTTWVAAVDTFHERLRAAAESTLSKR